MTQACDPEPFHRKRIGGRYLRVEDNTYPRLSGEMAHSVKGLLHTLEDLF